MLTLDDGGKSLKDVRHLSRTWTDEVDGFPETTYFSHSEQLALAFVQTGQVVAIDFRSNRVPSSKDNL